jgi:hypothetical protein
VDLQLHKLEAAKADPERLDVNLERQENPVKVDAKQAANLAEPVEPAKQAANPVNLAEVDAEPADLSKDLAEDPQEVVLKEETLLLPSD